MPTATKSSRRTVRYADLHELLADAERLAGGPHRTVGNWTYGQILHHVASVMNCTFDGFPFTVPWVARKLIAPLVKQRFLRNPMRAGFKLPAQARVLVSEQPVAVEEGLALLRRAVGRFESESPSQPHPFFGRMPRDETIQLQLRHAELHMSFVVPE